VCEWQANSSDLVHVFDSANCEGDWEAAPLNYECKDVGKKGSVMYVPK
jgi:hypothetical protein